MPGEGYLWLMSRFTCAVVVGVLLLLIGGLPGESAARAAGILPFGQVVDPVDPLEDPEAVQDKIEAGSPEETVLGGRR